MDTQIANIAVQGAPSSIDWHGFSLEGLGYQSRYSIRLKGRGRFFYEKNEFSALISIQVHDSRQSVNFHGELLCFEQRLLNEGINEIELHVGSSLHRLDNLSHERVFYQKNIVDIVRDLLGEHQILSHFDLSKSYPARAYIAQGAVSDYDFLHRLCSEYGLFFYYRHESDQAVLYFSDEKTEGKSHELPVIPFSGLDDGQPAIVAFSEQQHALADSIILRGSHELHAMEVWEARQSNRTAVPGNGLFELFDFQSFQSEQDLAAKADLMQQQLDWQRQLFHIKSSSVVLQPGDLLTANFILKQEQRHFQVFDVTISLTRIEGEGTALSSEIWLLPVERQFKALCPETQQVESPALPAAMSFRYKKPQPVFKLAEILGESQHQPELDEIGRYKIRLLFEGGLADGQFHYARLLQPAAGEGKTASQGFHFPLKPGVRVVVGHLDGHIDKPFILGCLPDNQQPSPVNITNSDSLYFENPEGLGFEWKERDDEHQSMHFYTEKTVQGFEFNKEQQQEYIRFSSLDTMSVAAEKNLSCRQQHLEALADSFCLQTEDELGLISEHNLYCHAGHELNINAGQSGLLKNSQGLTTCFAKENIRFQAASMIFSASSLSTRSQTGEIYAENGLKLEVQGVAMLECGESRLNFQDSSLVFNSPTLTVDAAQIKKHQGGVMNS